MAGSFDKVVSCEMIEAVGHDHLPAYFHAIGRALKPGGKAAIQVYSLTSDVLKSHHLADAAAVHLSFACFTLCPVLIRHC